MADYESEFLRICQERGFIHQCTDFSALDNYLSDGNGVAYIGFDCTAHSLHVGSLIQIMILRWLQKTGHKPIILIGGGTTKVGDPSGKEESRQLLDQASIRANIAGISSLFAKFLTVGNEENDAMVINNDLWLNDLNYIDFLRNYGRHFSVNRMLSFESVKQRLDREQSLSFLEFNYMLLQAYDFVELHERFGCRIQIGGSDQWGNIVNGIELGRRLGGEEELFGLTTPLLTTSSGAKMGKTADGAVWLDEDMLSAYDYWQFWRNVEDADVGKFLRLFTELPVEEIKRLEVLEGAELNDAKKVLATAATELCHGEKAAKEAAATAKATFEQGLLGEALPTIAVEKEELANGIPAFELLRRAGLVQSGGEARRLIRGGGGRINDEKIEDENMPVTLSFEQGGVVKLSSGKKKHALVKVV